MLEICFISLAVCVCSLLFVLSHGIVHSTAFVTPVMEQWLERKLAQWIHHEASIRRPTAPRADAPPLSYARFPTIK